MKNKFIVVIGSDRGGSYCNIIDYNKMDDIDNVYNSDVEMFLYDMGYENFQYIVTSDIVMHDDIYTSEVLFKRLFKHDFPTLHQMKNKDNE